MIKFLLPIASDLLKLCASNRAVEWGEFSGGCRGLIDRERSLACHFPPLSGSFEPPRTVAPFHALARTLWDSVNTVRTLKPEDQP